MASLQEVFPSEWNANVCRLAALLQQSRCGAGLGSIWKDASFLYREGIDILKDAVSIELHYLLKSSIERWAELICTARAQKLMKC